MIKFFDLDQRSDIAVILDCLAQAHELSDIFLRKSEKKSLNTMNENKEKFRFPMKGKIKTKVMKVNCLIQAELGGIEISDFGYFLRNMSS